MSDKQKPADLAEVRKNIKTYLEFYRSPEPGYKEMGRLQNILVQNDLGGCAVSDFVKIFDEEVGHYKNKRKS